MKKGILLFAHNTEKYDYFKMAISSVRRIKHFLNLPVTVVTDTNSVTEPNHNFDNLIFTEPDYSNKRDWGLWINKGRFKAYELSPYDETILLDTDYVVNSSKLLKLFDIDSSFLCHNKTSFFMQPNVAQERLSVYSSETLWATVVKFDKSTYCKQIFESLEMVQKNYFYYSMIHGFSYGTYRNDYSLTIALRLVNGHLIPNDNIIPWNLFHVGKNTRLHKVNETELDTEYLITYDNWLKGKIRKEYITIKDMDFHAMDKDDYMRIVYG